MHADTGVPLEFQGVAIPGKFSCLPFRYKKQAGDKQKPAEAGLCQAAIVPAIYAFPVRPRSTACPLAATSIIYRVIAIYYCGNITYPPALLPPSERSVRRLKHPCRAASYPDNGD